MPKLLRTRSSFAPAARSWCWCLPKATLAIGAPHLRAACRCADCRRERIDRDAVPDTGDTTIAEVRLVGDHALNITFSDGHDRGIYPWSYLRELAQEAFPGRDGHEAC